MPPTALSQLDNTLLYPSSIPPTVRFLLYNTHCCTILVYPLLSFFYWMALTAALTDIIFSIPCYQHYSDFSTMSRYFQLLLSLAVLIYKHSPLCFMSLGCASLLYCAEMTLVALLCLDNLLLYSTGITFAGVSLC